MRTRILAKVIRRKYPLAVLLVFFSRLVSADEESMWRDAPFIEPPAWREETLELPAYPQKDRLLEVPVSLSGYAFRVFIDPNSLSTGGDHVVRYTAVLVSSSDVWNTSYEGLHCGKREYRRYAYGSNGNWFPIEASLWQRVTDAGMDHYRYVLYGNYLCDPVRPDPDVEEILKRIRHPSGLVLHD